MHRDRVAVPTHRRVWNSGESSTVLNGQGAANPAYGTRTVGVMSSAIRNLVPVLLAVSLAAAACGGGSDGAQSSSTTIPTSTIELTPTSDVAVPTTAAETSTTTEASTTTEVTTTTAAETTTTTAPTPTTTTTTTPPEETPVALSPTGVGPLQFGTPPDDAVEFLTAVLGLPTYDSGWESSFSEFGTCPGGEVRGVRFGPLTVLFSDGPTSYGPAGTRHFFSWTYSAFDTPDIFGLTTPQGLGLGASTEDVESVYPGVTINPADDFFPASFQSGGIFGTFDDSGRVQYLSAGDACGE